MSPSLVVRKSTLTQIGLLGCLPTGNCGVGWIAVLWKSSLAKLHQAEFSQVDVNDNIMLLVEKIGKRSTMHAIILFAATNIELASEMLRFRQLGFKEGVTRP